MTPTALDTRDRILQTAGELFGQQGFKPTTIRQIATSANVNIAAIHYHFGDKQGLYGAVLERIFTIGFTRFPYNINSKPDAPAEERLHFFIRALLYRLLSSEGWGGHAGHGRLLARELIEPSPAFDTILNHYLRPHKDLLLDIITAIIGKNPGPALLLPCAISIIGQCIYYALAAPVIERLTGKKQPNDQELDHLAEFIYHFSLSGIHAVASAAPFRGVLAATAAERGELR